MPTLKDAALMTSELDRLGAELHAELTEGEIDFEKMVRLADSISENADRLAAALRRAVESSPGGEARDGQPSAGGRANRPPAQSSTESSRDEGRRSTRADSTPREAGQSRASGSGASQSDAAQSEAPQAPSPLP